MWLPSGAHHPVTWWELAVAFGAAEVFPIHLEIRRETLSVSLVELPLVVGLLLSGPWQVVLGQTAGCLIAWGVIRRQALQKLAFNTTLCLLEASVAIPVYHLLAGTHSAADPHVWLAAYLAVMVESTLSCVGLIAVMTVVTGKPPADIAENFVRSAVVVPAATTAAALTASIALQATTTAVVLFAVLGAVLVAGYTAYNALRNRYAGLDLLYKFTQTTQDAPKDWSGLEDLLREACHLLGAEVAQLVLRLDGAGYRRYSYTGECVTNDSSEHAPLYWPDDAADRGILAPRRTTTTRAAAWLEHIGWGDGMVAPLRRNGAIIGTLAVGNRVDAVSTFDEDHFTLFGTLASHTAMTVENTLLIDQLRYEASHDLLTGLANRAEIDRRLAQSLAVRGVGSKVAVALIDVDRFKEVNDTLGHHAGDELLSWLGGRLVELLPEGSLAGRLGGDEFVVCLPVAGVDDKAAAGEAVEALLRPLWATPFVIHEMKIDMSASVGVAVAPDDGEDPELLLQRADVAMYVAKRRSGHVNVYSAKDDVNTERRLTLAAELRDAIEARQLTVYYQPKVDLSTGFVSGAEALVRWEHPRDGLIAPDEFIPLAEKTGLIVPLTQLVLDRAMEDCRAWETWGLRLNVAVNVSVRNLVDPTLISTITHLLALHELCPERLTIEVTESGVMEDERHNIGILEALAALGVQLAIDDFGTGYSSLAYLRQLPVHEVKIDKSFVMRMLDQGADAAIVRSVIDLARNVGLKVVAEGIENEPTFRALADLGCTTGQGFYIGRPLPLPEFVDGVQRWRAPVSVPSLQPMRLVRAVD